MLKAILSTTPDYHPTKLEKLNIPTSEFDPVEMREFIEEPRLALLQELSVAGSQTFGDTEAELLSGNEVLHLRASKIMVY